MTQLIFYFHFFRTGMKNSWRNCRGMIYYSFKLQKRIFNPLDLRENCSKGKGLIPVNTLLAHHHYFLSFFFLLVFSFSFLFFFYHRACALQQSLLLASLQQSWKKICYVKTNDRCLASSILLTTVFCDYSTVFPSIVRVFREIIMPIC